jgi:molybdate/tungstate transport system substrate-binding protein
MHANSLTRLLLRLARLLCLATALAPQLACAADGTSVLYAGSLVDLMEHSLGPAFNTGTGEQFLGYAGGSSKLANEIKSQLRRGDVFISANPKVDEQLMGAANGNWVSWYIQFAESPLVIGYSGSSRFAAELTHKPWYEVLAQPGIKIGRTDPALDPKGAFTLELMQRAEQFYHQPGLAGRVLGKPDNPAQVLPEEALLGRLQSGELDVAFLYSTEASQAGVPAIQIEAQIDPKARYTATILRDAPNPAGAQRFLQFLLGASGQQLLRQHGLVLDKPTLAGDVQAVPPALRSLTDRSQ